MRLGDTSPRGRLRLDAIARYLQDIANDDATAGGLDNAMGWVVRRTAIEVLQPLRLLESVELTTFCSGVGGRWAERRTSLRGDQGGHVEASALWVHVEPATGRPQRLGADFDGLYGEAHGGRLVSARLAHGEPPAPGVTDLHGGGLSPFPLRFADFDVLGHVNNAVYWAMVEDVLASRRERQRSLPRAPGDPAPASPANQASPAGTGPLLIEVEHRRALGRGGEPRLLVVEGGDELSVWVLDQSEVVASARVVGGAGTVESPSTV